MVSKILTWPSAILDHERRLAIRNELLEMGATVSNISDPRPYDIGSQFETFSARTDRTKEQTKAQVTDYDSDDSTLLGGAASHISDNTSTNTTITQGASTISASDGTSQPFIPFSEDGLDSDDQDGMNYQMLLNYQGKSYDDEFEPQFQKGNYLTDRIYNTPSFK